MFALPFTLALGRLGCALQHGRLGVSTSHWLAVGFPDGRRFDLGLVEFLYAILMCIVFIAAPGSAIPPQFPID